MGLRGSPNGLHERIQVALMRLYNAFGLPLNPIFMHTIKPMHVACVCVRERESIGHEIRLALTCKRFGTTKTNFNEENM